MSILLDLLRAPPRPFTTQPSGSRRSPSYRFLPYLRGINREHNSRSQTTDSCLGRQRPQPRVTLSDMPLLVIKNIVRFVAPRDRLALEPILSPVQRGYVANEIASARITHIDIPAVRSIPDLDKALMAIERLSPKFRGPLLIGLAGYCYRFAPHDHVIASAMLTSYIREHHHDEAGLAQNIAAILDEESFCRLLLSGVTHKHSLKERAAAYLIYNEVTINRFEIKIIENQAWSDILAGENCQSIAAKYGITTLEGLKRLEFHVSNALANDSLEGMFNCRDIAMRYGIQTTFGQVSLQLKAIDHIPQTVLEQSVHCRKLATGYGIDTVPALVKLEERFLNVLRRVPVKGYHVQRLAAQFGITTLTIISLLEKYVIENIAGVEVGKGSHCGEVAEKYGITTSQGRILLETQAAYGLPGKSATLGSKCNHLMQYHGLVTDAARQILERQALGGALRAEALRGGNCDRLIAKYGICRSDSRRLIEEIIHSGLITSKCDLMLNCNQIAEKYGIGSEAGRVAIEIHKAKEIAENTLLLGNRNCRDLAQRYRIITQPGQLALQSHIVELCNEIYSDPLANPQEMMRRYGLTHPSAVAKLERQLIRRSVIKEAIAAGRNCLKIAAQYGVQQSETLILLQLDMVQATAGPAVRRGMNCLQAAQRFGIIDPGALVELEMFCLNRALKAALEEGNHRAVAARCGISSPAVIDKLIRGYILDKNKQRMESGQ